MSFNHQEEMGLLQRILACISAGLFFFYTIFQKVTFNTISVNFISHFHLSATDFGAISSAYLYANALWLIPGGILLEKYSAKTVTIIFTLLCASSSFLFAFSHDVTLDIIARFIGGLGSAMSLLISLRLANRLFPNHAARATGLLISLGMSAGFFANAPFLHLVQDIGWQNGLLLTGYFGMAIAIFMLFYLHDIHSSFQKIPITLPRTIRDIKNVARNTINWKNGIYIGLMNLPIFILASLWGDLYLTHTTAYTDDQASLIVSMIFLGEITGAPIIGWISDKLEKRKPVMLAGAVLSFLITLPLFNCNAFSTISLSAIFFLLGFFLSAQVIGYSVVSERNNPAVVSTASGFTSSIVNTIGGICQIVFPLFLTIENYKVAFCMFPVAFLAAIFVASNLKESYASIKTQKSNSLNYSEGNLLSHS